VDRDRLRALLLAVQRGEVDPEGALEELAHLPFVDTPHARVDTHRALRQGLPEVVFGPGKTAEQIVGIVRVLLGEGQTVLATRVEAEMAAAVLRELPEGEYDEAARLLWYGPAEVPIRGKGTIAVVSAGTSDRPVSSEANTIHLPSGDRLAQRSLKRVPRNGWALRSPSTGIVKMSYPLSGSFDCNTACPVGSCQSSGYWRCSWSSNSSDGPLPSAGIQYRLSSGR